MNIKAGSLKNVFLFSLLISLSVLTRLLAIVTPYTWSDEGIVAIMSLGVMKGEFPVFFYGQRFMGSLEAYLQAIIFYLFGPSSLTLEFLPALLSILFLFLVYYLAQKLWGYKVAFLSGILIAIPSSDLMRWSYEARSHYPLTLIFGTFLFIGTIKIACQNPTKGNRFLLYGLLGLIAGLGLWTNYLIITYLIPVALFLFLNNKKFLFSKDSLFSFLLFLSGTLPLWIFNIIHHVPLGGMAGITNLGSVSDLSAHLKGIFMGALPILLGLRTPEFDHKALGHASTLYEDRIAILAIFLLGFIYTLSLIAFVLKNRRGIQSILFHFRLKNTKGSELLIFLFLVTVVLSLITRYGAQLSLDSKYLLPLYTCIPIFLATFLVDLGTRTRIISVSFFLIIVLFNIYGNVKHGRWVICNPDKLKNYYEEVQKEARLKNFLLENSLNRIYTDSQINDLGTRLILSSKEGIICSDTYGENYLKYANMVDGSKNVTYLYLGEDRRFEENLKAVGGSYRKIKNPDGYIFYTDFKPPSGGFQLVPRYLWKGKSNPPSADVPMAFDDVVGSIWAVPQEPGNFFEIDFGRMESINKFSYIPGSYRDVPCGFQLNVSKDGIHWQEVSSVSSYWGPIFWSGPHPMVKIRRGRIEVSFPSVTCRFIRIVLNGKLEGYEWSIDEIFVYGPGYSFTAISYKDLDFINLVNFLRTEKIEFVYADHWLSGAIRIQSNWTIGTIVSNHFTDNYGGKDPPVDSFPKVTLTKKMAFILEENNRRSFEAILKENNYSYRSKRVGSFSVYFDIFPPNLLILPARNWKVFSNVNGQGAERAIDYDLNTRWTSLRPQESGMSFKIDLGEIRKIKGFSLWQGKSLQDYPRALKVLGSRNGKNWQEIATRWFSDFFWSGEQLIKMRGEKISYLFSPTDLRYLKLIQEGKSSSNYWSIYELEVVDAF